MLIVCIITALFCALQSIRASTLLIASLWLGGVSVTVAISLYLVGAPEIAVIELSVSAGLVMILLVFAITVLGDSIPRLSRSNIGYLVIVGVVTLSLVFLTLPELHYEAQDDSYQLATVLWHDRSLDVVLQISLLFAGALTVLSLLRSPSGNAEEDDEIIAEVQESYTPDKPHIISEPETSLEKEPV